MPKKINLPSLRAAAKKNRNKTSKSQLFFSYTEATADYLTHISDARRFVYVETPKVACTTIKRALQIIENNGSTAGLSDNVHDRHVSPLQKLSSSDFEVKEIYTSGDLFRFCFVRDPFTRIVSAYLDKLVINNWERKRRLPTLGYKPTASISLKTFLKTIRAQKPENMDIHWMPQAVLLRPDTVFYDVIGRFETFQVHFEKVISKIEPSFLAGNSDFDFSKHKTGANSKAIELIGSEEADLIRELYAKDFEIFDYSPSWPPTT